MTIAQDAYVLSYILSDVSGTNLKSQVHLITQVYDAIRRPIGNAVLVSTKACGKLTELTDDENELPFVKEYDDRVPHEVLEAYMKKLEHHWKFLWNAFDTVEEQCQNALNML